MQKLLVLSVFLGLCPCAFAQEKLLTKTYDLSHLLTKKVRWPGTEGKWMIQGMDGIIQTIVRELPPKDVSEKSLRMRAYNGKLEIRSSAASLEFIGTILNAINTLMAINIEVQAGLYEVERAYFQKRLAPGFNKSRMAPITLPEDEQEEFRNKSRAVRSRSVMLNQNETGQLFSLREAIPYQWLARHGRTKEVKVADTGIRLEAELQVSGDRRFVEMHLMQKAADLVQTLSVAAIDAQLNTVKLRVPQIRQTCTRVSVTVPDGVLLLVSPTGPLPGYDAKDAVPLIVLRPIIRCDNEEKLKPIIGK